MTEREALKLALEELAVRFSEGWHEGIKIDASDIMLLNNAAQALAEAEGERQPERSDDRERSDREQEPVATVQCINGVTIGYLDVMQPVGTKLYTNPLQRTWVGLTKKEKSLFSSWLDHKTDDEVFSAIEAKLKEKNT